MTFKVVFKSLFVGYLIIGMIVSIPFAILIIAGKMPIMINDKPQYGLIGLLIPFIYAPLCSAISALLNALVLLLGFKVSKGKSSK
jgi:hypothetical protein